jgi:hypothetical protein
MNPSTGAFCESCGQALPSALPTSPRIVSAGTGFAGTAIGRGLQSEELHKQAKKAAGALLAVAVIQAVVGPLQVLLVLGNAPARLRNAAFVEVFTIAFVFFVIFLWARKQPLPAAIVGLVLFITLQVIYGILDPTNLFKGILLKIIIIAILVNAIQAGVKYRQIQREAGGA